MSIKFKPLWPVITAVLTCTMATAASAETLVDAIVTAYQNSPTIQAQRADLTIVRDRYVQAQAGYAPTVGLTARMQSVTTREDYPHGLFYPDVNTKGMSLSFVQALYTGGRVSSDVSAARAEVLAGAEQLRLVEMKVIQSVIQAYIDVRRDQQIAQISEENVALLQKQLEDTEARCKVREVTITDLATAQSRLDSAKAQSVSAQGQLAISRARYMAVVGVQPGVLEAETELPGVPEEVDAAMEAAKTENPDVLAAQYKEQASRERIKGARAASAPQVDLRADATYGPILNYDPVHNQEDYSLSVVVSKSLFSGGLNRARAQEASDSNTRDRLMIDIARRQAVQDVGEAWARLLASQTSHEYYKAQIMAAQTAFDGVRQEEKVGLRSTLDVLNLDQELAAARVSAAQAGHDEFSARAAVLLAMGKLDIYHLTGGDPHDSRPDRRARRFYEISPTEFAPRLLEKLSKIVNH